MSGFSFSSSSTSTSAPVFSFSSASSQSSSPFSLSNPPPLSSAAPATSPFSFGTTPSSSSPSPFGSVTPSTGFLFRSSPFASSSSLSNPSSASLAGSQSSSASSTSVSPFGFGSTSSAPSTTPFGFGISISSTPSSLASSSASAPSLPFGPNSAPAAPSSGLSAAAAVAIAPAVVLKVALSEGGEGIQGEDELATVEEIKEPVVPMVEQGVVSGIGHIQDKNVEVMDPIVVSYQNMKLAGIQESVVSTASIASGSIPVEVPTDPMELSAAAVAITPAAKVNVVTTKASKPKSATVVSLGSMSFGERAEREQEDPHIDVDMEVENESAAAAASSAATRDEAGACGVGTQASPIVSQFIDVNGYLLSPQNGLIVKRILGKYGDIAKGSTLRSMAAKSAILELVADAVHRLYSHTMDTLGSAEVQLIDVNVADAGAVGFEVDWLRQRIDKVIATSNYQVHKSELDELGQRIKAAKKSLMEMEQRETVLMREVAARKAEMEVNRLIEGSSLGEGLL